MILEFADAAPIKSSPMKSAEYGQMTGAMRLKRVPGDGADSPDSFCLFRKVYEKTAGNHPTPHVKLISCRRVSVK